MASGDTSPKPDLFRIGIIGCGRAGIGLHVPALTRIPNVRIVALADADPRHLQACGIEVGVERLYSDFRDLLLDPSVDVVLIAVPTAFHAEVFLAAMAAKKHTYLEKPLALTLDQADSMTAAAAGSPASVVVGFNLRSHRLVRKARALIASGALGPIELVRTILVGGVPERPAWQLRRAQGGGALFELGIHHFDLWRFLLDDEVISLQAESVSGSAEDAKAVIAARFGGGALASTTLAMGGTAMHEIEVMGDAGALRFSLYRADSFELKPRGRLESLVDWTRQLPDAARAARTRGDYLDSYRVHWTDFLDAIRAGRTQNSLEDGRKALEIALAAAEATGRTVRVG